MNPTQVTEKLPLQSDPFSSGESPPAVFYMKVRGGTRRLMSVGRDQIKRLTR